MFDHSQQLGQYSANVAAVLAIDGQTLPLSKLSPTTLYLKQGAEFNAGPGIVELVIDHVTRCIDDDVIYDGVPYENTVLIRQLST